MSITHKILSAAVLLGLLVVTGCSQQNEAAPSETETEDAAVSSAAAQTEEGLPIWAPEEPSPEFLRAAEILKPLPKEMAPDPAMGTVIYEFFGTLTEEQLEEFKKDKLHSTPVSEYKEAALEHIKAKYGATVKDGQVEYTMRSVSFGYKDFTPAQLAAFEKVCEVFKEVNRGNPDKEDLLIALYEAGATEDLSNVYILFGATGHVVGAHFAAVNQGEDGFYYTKNVYTSDFAQY